MDVNMDELKLAREGCAQAITGMPGVRGDEAHASLYRDGTYDGSFHVNAALYAINLYREASGVPTNPEPRFTQRSGTWQPVPANPELDEAMHGAVADRVVEDFTAALGPRRGFVRNADGSRMLINELPKQKPLYDKLVAPQGRKQVTIFVPERGVDGKTIRPLVVEKELNQVFGWYLATHGVRGSADAAKTPVIAFTVAVADDLGVRDAVGIAGRAAALTGTPVTVTLDTGDMVKVDAMGRFV